MGTKGKILIIDDSVVVIKWTQAVLKEAGFEVVAQSQPIGSSATILREKPDLVLLDVAMPALGGEEVLLSIRSHDAIKNCAIALYSSRDPNELARIATATDADGFIPKTRDAKELLREVTALLAHTRDRGASACLGGTMIPLARVNPLFVDDDERLLAVYKRMYGREMGGTYVSSAEEAFACLQSERPPSVVICDVVMPGINGVDLFHEAVAFNPDWRRRFAFVTGRAYTEPAESLLKTVEAPVLYKPVSRDALMGVINQILGQENAG
jgi:DNA-binding NtrC family response regulator